MNHTDQSVSLKFYADIAWVTMIKSVIEQGAPVFGLDQDKTMYLMMAAEELVVHLAQTAPGTEIRCNFSSGRWNVLVDFSFTADPSDLWAMNLTAKPPSSVQSEMDYLGLLLASRVVDNFTVRLEGEIVHLTLRQDCNYPLAKKEKVKLFQSQGELSIAQSPESALIKTACERALGLYPAHLLHQAFSTPGKVVDMVAQKDLNIGIALDKTGALTGMIAWHAPSEQSISFFGPYVFAKADQTTLLLTEHLINCVARTRVMGLFSERATKDIPTKNFESLGYLSFIKPDKDYSQMDVWYRHLREDIGASVWAHPTMVKFLEKIYEKQVLMRDIRTTDGQGENMPERSVLSTQLRAELGEASLVPMVTGKDAADCVARHIKTLYKENFNNIFFKLDLAYGWQAALGGILEDNGFVPKLVLPYGGRSDVVVYQHDNI